MFTKYRLASCANRRREDFFSEEDEGFTIFVFCCFVFLYGLCFLFLL